MKEQQQVRLIASLCSYCKAIISCCVSGSCVITQDTCSDCDQTPHCRIVFNVKKITEEYKKLGAEFPTEMAIEDVTGSRASHGCCQDCADRVLRYVDGGSA